MKYRAHREDDSYRLAILVGLASARPEAFIAPQVSPGYLDLGSALAVSTFLGSEYVRLAAAQSQRMRTQPCKAAFNAPRH